LLACVSGCETTVLITPNVGAGAKSTCTIQAAVSYEGNPDYLPHAIATVPVGSQTTFLRYTYNTAYNAKEGDAVLQAVNPLMLFGFPTGYNSGTISGLLEVVQNGQTIRSYAAACNMKRHGTVFSEGETLTDMRRRGLQLVADNISTQICRDQPTLKPLINPDH
jgi:hypothetical protein